MNLSSISRIAVAIGTTSAGVYAAREWLQLGLIGGLQPTLVAVLFILTLAVVVLIVQERSAEDRRISGFLVATVAVAAVVLIARAGDLRTFIEQPDETNPPMAQSSLDLAGSEISGRSFAGMSLRGSNFSGSTLVDADFRNADLSEADLSNSVLGAGTNISGSDLCAADLRGADLALAAGLKDVRRWDFAFYDSRTKWPEDFDPEVAGGLVLVSSNSTLYSCTPGSTSSFDVGGRS